MLLAVPAATVFFAYRSYILQRQHDEALDLLHETTRTLARSSEVRSSIESLLRQCLRAFRADLAEVVLFTNEGPRADDDHRGGLRGADGRVARGGRPHGRSRAAASRAAGMATWR